MSGFVIGVCPLISDNEEGFLRIRLDGHGT